MFKTVLLSIVFAASCFAQFGMGIKAGIPATDAFESGSIQSLASNTIPGFVPVVGKADRYVVGPYLELRIRNWAAEIDALYRKYEITSAAGSASPSSWEFPVLLKHRWGDSLVHPFLDFGASFKHISDVRFATLAHPTTYGVVGGAGVELSLLGLRIAPELRYTNWGPRQIQDVIQSSRGELTFLVGFGF